MKKLFILLNAALILLVGCSDETTINSSENSDLVPITENTSTEHTDSSETTTAAINTGENNSYSAILFDEIKAKAEILRAEYKPFSITDNIAVSTGYDYNLDGIDDYIVVFNTYMQFDMVFFDGVTAEIIREIHQMIFFQEDFINIEIYKNYSGDMAFKRANRYQHAAAYDSLFDSAEIELPDKGYIFHATYDLDNNFIRADEYSDEESYLAAQDALLEGYDYITDIKWAGSFDYMDKNTLQVLNK